MATQTLWLIVGFLWLFVITELLLLMALAQQVGKLHLRLGPVGARGGRGSPGPEVGSKVEPIELKGPGDRVVRLGGDRHAQTLAVFVAPSCRPCGICQPL